MKKIIAMLLCLAMVMGLALTAFADDETATYTLTISNTTAGHTYNVYQIFVGDLAKNEDGKLVLSNITYGANYGTEGEPVPEDVLTAITSADAFAASVEVTEPAFKDGIQSEAGSTAITGLPAGYYLVKDVSESVPDGEAYTKFILQVVGDTSIAVKAGTTSSEKKVDDKNDSNTSEDETVWRDSADYDIGDYVPFQLKAVVASDYANYTHGYKLTFHDQMDAGLTFVNDADHPVVVKVNGTAITEGFEIVTTGLTDGCTFEVRFANLKNIPGVAANSEITVEYYAQLNENAKIGAEGNSNKSHITYTNNPNDDQAGENGKTPDDTTIVFTYQLVVNKVDGENKPLAGATFTLYKKNADGEYVEFGVLEAVAVTGDDGETVVSYTANFKGLDDGEYKLVETVTPAGYNTAADIEFTVTAGHLDGDAPGLETLDGGDIGTGVVSTGTLTTTVINNAGATLPSTGGMGTTILYVVGGILVVGAGVLLITKRRMMNIE